MKSAKFLLLVSALFCAAVAQAGLVGADNDTDELISINAATGAGSSIGAFGIANVIGLTYDTKNNVLYGVNNGTDELLTINPSTGAATAVGPYGVDAVGALAYDSDTDTLYGSDLVGGELVTVNRSTGAVTSVGSFVNTAVISGMAYDSGSGTLYGASLSTNELYSIDRATGVATSIGALGFSGVSGLAFDPNSGTLYGVDGNSDQLVTINTATGAATAVGALGFANLTSLAWAPTCTIDQTLSYSGGTLTLDYTLGTSAPAVWKVFLSANAAAVPVITLNLPVIDPAIPASIPIPNFPSIGVVGYLTTLTVAGQGIACSDWDTVDTGQPAPGPAPNLGAIIQSHQR